MFDPWLVHLEVAVMFEELQPRPMTRLAEWAVAANTFANRRARERRKEDTQRIKLRRSRKPWVYPRAQRSPTEQLRYESNLKSQRAWAQQRVERP